MFHEVLANLVKTILLSGSAVLPSPVLVGVLVIYPDFLNFRKAIKTIKSFPILGVQYKNRRGPAPPPPLSFF